MKVRDKHKILIDECDNEEEEDDEMKCYEMKEEGSGAAKRKDKGNDVRVTNSNGVNNEIEEDHEALCVKHKILQENSALKEVMHEMLLSDIKLEFLTLKVHSDDEDYESEEKMYEEIDKKRNAIKEKTTLTM